MSTDPFTPEELVKLVMFCGKEAVVTCEGTVDVFYQVSMGRYVTRPWQPHLPEGAVQMMELVEALLSRGHQVELLLAKDDICATVWCGTLGHSATVSSPGAAVCRATLKMIGAT